MWHWLRDFHVEIHFLRLLFSIAVFILGRVVRVTGGSSPKIQNQLFYDNQEVLLYDCNIDLLYLLTLFCVEVKGWNRKMTVGMLNLFTAVTFQTRWQFSISVWSMKLSLKMISNPKSDFLSSPSAGVTARKGWKRREGRGMRVWNPLSFLSAPLLMQPRQQPN